MSTEHDLFMAMALEEARAAEAHDDVPVGAVIVVAGAILARGHNRREIDQDPTAHAEIVALRRAAMKLQSWRLSEATLYVTLEPCPMCAGALVNARIHSLVFGANDPKAGAVGSLCNLCQDPRLNHRLNVTRGIQAEACGQILRDFFKKKRSSKDA